MNKIKREKEYLELPRFFSIEEITYNTGLVISFPIYEIKKKGNKYISSGNYDNRKLFLHIKKYLEEQGLKIVGHTINPVKFEGIRTKKAQGIYEAEELFRKAIFHECGAKEYL